MGHLQQNTLGSKEVQPDPKKKSSATTQKVLVEQSFLSKPLQDPSYNRQGFFQHPSLALISQKSSIHVNISFG